MKHIFFLTIISLVLFSCNDLSKEIVIKSTYKNTEAQTYENSEAESFEFFNKVIGGTKEEVNSTLIEKTIEERNRLERRINFLSTPGKLEKLTDNDDVIKAILNKLTEDKYFLNYLSKDEDSKYSDMKSYILGLTEKEKKIILLNKYLEYLKQVVPIIGFEIKSIEMAELENEIPKYFFNLNTNKVTVTKTGQSLTREEFLNSLDPQERDFLEKTINSLQGKI